MNNFKSIAATALLAVSGLNVSAQTIAERLLRRCPRVLQRIQLGFCGQLQKRPLAKTSRLTKRMAALVHKLAP
jgi:hypothetical protein